MDYRTRYPRTVVLEGGRAGGGGSRGGADGPATDPVRASEQLHLVVTESPDRLCRIFAGEGFTKVRFEHKRPSQLGSGLSRKIGGPWEMHMRMSRMGAGREIMIHAEVEVSRDYMQHLFSQRAPVVYEVARILEGNRVGYRIWSQGAGRYVSEVVADYRVRLSAPGLPAFAWKPVVFAIGTVGVFYLAKYLLTI